ncbi:MAG: tRNA 5-hydroxyuridine modification protein YegQ [Gammaproteobacteria bacterium]|nr:tRNA 5-hydroxyuridine modification protein YegQ [Gammaproteobacteria bacterium]
MRAPELLLPAGTLNNMRYAYAYGADAVYAGQPRYSLRVRNNDFDLKNLEIGIQEAHAQGKQFFVASNLMPHNAKIKTYMADMAPVIALKPDAIIMADPGLIMMVREKWPEVPIHLSVQANTVNWAAVKFWQSMGLTRVILSRELSLNEVEEIRQQCPDMEIEVFVHGALCIAYSGRCLLSGYFNHRDPNQGSCTNSCRWDYKMHNANESESGDVQKIEFDAMAAMKSPALFSGAGNTERHPLADGVYLIEEKHRAGEFMPIIEDEHGTYIMNSRDLRAVEHVQRLVEIGVDSLKIEGRTKSHYYVARTAQVYRQAIDDAVAGRPFNPNLSIALDGLANRGYTDAFYQRHKSHETQNYEQSNSLSSRQQFVAEITGYDEERGMLELLAKNKFAIGDSLELMLPSGNVPLQLESIETLRGAAMEEVPGGGYEVRIPMPKGDYQLGLIAKNLPDAA